jgi:serine/threonine-protein kinase
VVTDFGIARAAAGDSRLTVTGVAVGTPAYMSPEQALGEREIDGRSDIYSLGVVAYQMLSGEPPFRAANTPAMLVKHLSESPRPLQNLRPDAPQPLVHAIMRALAKKPEHRWNDAAEFRAALTGQHEAAAYVDPAPQPRSEPAPPPRVEPPPAHYQSPFQDRDRGAEQGRLPVASDVPPMPPLPPLPTFGSRAEWKQWRRMQRDWDEERKRRERQALKSRRKDGERDRSRPIEERIASWRHSTLGGLSTVAVLGVVNALTSFGHWWFIFPGAFITLGVVTKGGKLWADGVPIDRLLSRGKLDADSPESAPQLGRGRDVNELALRLAPVEVLAGPHGQSVRRAADDRAAVEETIARLAPAEREMIPDVLPTVIALSERVGSLSLTLHRLDQDVSGASVSSLDERLAALRAESGPTPTPEQERRIALLQRQRGTIGELVERRQVLAAQQESAALALQNLRLDLLKLRSSGLGSVMSDLTSATQDARAISRDIEHAVDAVREVKRL